MSGGNGEPDPDTVARDARIDALCDRFEDAWLAGRPVGVTEFLRGAGIDPAAEPELVRELVRVRAAYRGTTAAPGEEHPAPEQLTACARGELPADAAAAAERHVRQCARCAALLDELTGGPLGAADRRANEPPATAGDPTTTFIAARPMGAVERTWKWVRRHPARAAAGATVVAAVVAAALAAPFPFAAERKRLDEFRTADEAARADRQQARADALVRSLTSADTALVPRIVSDLAEVRDRARPQLVELAARPEHTKPGLHARLALLALAEESPAGPAGPPQIGRAAEWAAELAAYVPVCKSDELVPVRGFLTPYTGTVAPGLWAVLLDARADAGKRIRAAGALAGLVPNDPRWESVAPVVAETVVKANPVEFVAWSAALDPVRGALVPALMNRYPAARARIREDHLDEDALAAAAREYDLTANALARYVADRPTELAELALLADPRHYPELTGPLREHRADVVRLLKAELVKTPQLEWTDAALDARGCRRGHAAAALIALGEGEAVWPIFRFPPDGDPTARNYLLRRLRAIGADPLALVRRFAAETDVSARRALLVALGDFPPDEVPRAEREELTERLLTMYREHPDPGLHGAIDWVLRQRWGKGNELAAIDARLAGAPQGASKNWYVNGAGQTFAVVPGPVEFTIGSPPSEPNRVPQYEPQHKKSIGRTFAISTKEVTVEQFLRFQPRSARTKPFGPGPETPAVGVTWYEAAAYCNWLSAREGIPAEQWCYEPNGNGTFADGMGIKPGHLNLTGYRLPTEAEWEFACRGGAVTARYYGRGDELLPRYGWFVKNANEGVRPVGALRPNELGLFDTLGNAVEWADDVNGRYDTGQFDDIENDRHLRIDEQANRSLRGGSVLDRAPFLRSAVRASDRPGAGGPAIGFRPARTLPSPNAGPPPTAPGAAKTVTNSIGMKLVRIPSGTFVMGLPKSEKILYDNEAEHEVEITRPFYLGAFEVTQEQYEKVTGRNPSYFAPTGPGKDQIKGLDTKAFPVEGVEWADAVAFCKVLSERPDEVKAGRKYRLPTEAEWEYACRAGTRTRFSFGDKLTLEDANFDGRFMNEGARPPGALGRTRTVGSYKPNAWGLYDMHGNVWEWCQDWYQPDYYAKSPKQDPPGPNEGSQGRRVRRGGDFSFFGLHARSGARFPYQSNSSGTGFRVLCEIAAGIGWADEPKTAGEVRASFQKFAAAVEADNYEDAARWISPPADRVWTNFGLMRAAAAKYDAALEEKFGKSDDPPLLRALGSKGGLAEHFYETRGEIQDVKEAGTDRVHVRVWTKRPDWRKASEIAVYERTFTATRTGDQWTFQLHSFGGTPALKTVKRNTRDGKEVEVYAEHEPRKGGDEKNWVELKPISSDGREDDLREEAAGLVKFAELLKSQTELVLKGTYKTRKEALEGLQKATPKR